MTFTISDFSIIICAVVFVTYIVTKEYYKYKMQQLKEKHTQILEQAFRNHNTTKNYCEPTLFNIKKMNYEDEHTSN